MPHLENIRQILTDALGLRHLHLDESTALLGNIPELDSMAVATVITALEEHFGFQIHDDEISARHFETLGTLNEFVRAKLA